MKVGSVSVTITKLPRSEELRRKVNLQDSKIATSDWEQCWTMPQGLDISVRLARCASQRAATFAKRLVQALAPYAERILAIDRSQGMVDIYNEISGKLKEDDTLRCDMRAVCGDLIPDRYDDVLGIGEADERDYSEFDTIAVCVCYPLQTFSFCLISCHFKLRDAD